MLFSACTQANCYGVVTAGGGAHYWHQVVKGAQAAADELDMTIVTRGIADERNDKAQVLIMKSIRQQGCSGFLLAPSSDALLDLVAEFDAIGIPTVFIDRDIGGERRAVLKTNNHHAGKLVAMKIAQLTPPQATIGVLRTHELDKAVTARVDGFVGTAETMDLDIVFNELVGTKVGESRSKITELLQQHPDIDAIFSPNENTTVATIASLDAIGNEQRPVHIGFDSNKYIVDSMANGKLAGFMVQDPYLMGYQATKALHRIRLEKPISETTDIPAIFINRDNYQHPEVSSKLVN
ncbi:sugar ABC transporter substrate-binding protein [Neiella marina]|uniref:Sugar ABC transporter substrate-binding protein n=1 Tax=Neiella marina TaxID=508461 RepID=A0A8J2U5T4_9GAMM|nr:substrate-binding domain-containing protein [Neiella marina]GGA80113.1 sugar ABC transporter substrate-binding protein [Neiella marina]